MADRLSGSDEAGAVVKQITANPAVLAVTVLTLIQIKMVPVEASSHSAGDSAERRMNEYRFYKLDTWEKTTGPPYVVQCEDDDAARNLAQLFADGETRDIWECARRVARMSARHANTMDRAN